LLRRWPFTIVIQQDLTKVSCRYSKTLQKIQIDTRAEIYFRYAVERWCRATDKYMFLCFGYRRTVYVSTAIDRDAKQIEASQDESATSAALLELRVIYGLQFNDPKTRFS
jgi:hypothetical protein